MASGFRRSVAAEFPSGFDDLYLAFHFRVDVTPDYIAQTPRRTRQRFELRRRGREAQSHCLSRLHMEGPEVLPSELDPVFNADPDLFEQVRGEAMGHGILIMNHDHRVL